MERYDYTCMRVTITQIGFVIRTLTDLHMERAIILSNETTKAVEREKVTIIELYSSLKNNNTYKSRDDSISKYSRRGNAPRC